MADLMLRAMDSGHLLSQQLDDLLVFENDRGRNAAALPVHDALDGPALLADTDELGERRSSPGLFDDRSGLSCIHGPDGTPIVYPNQPNLCTRNVHIACSVTAVSTTVFQRMLELALARKGWDRVRLQKELDVSKQTMTNWQARGVPPGKYRLIATTIGCSLDELAGRATAADKPPSPIVLLVTQADLDAMEAAKRETIIPLIKVIEGAVRGTARKLRSTHGP